MTNNGIQYFETRDLVLESILALYNANGVSGIETHRAF
jgi:hypothetical protein